MLPEAILSENQSMFVIKIDANVTKESSLHFVVQEQLKSLFRQTWSARNYYLQTWQKLVIRKAFRDCKKLTSYLSLWLRYRGTLILK